MEALMTCSPRPLSQKAGVAAWATLAIAGLTSLGLPFALQATTPVDSIVESQLECAPVGRASAPGAPETPSYPYSKQIQAIARKYQVAPELIASIVRLESNFDRYCVSPVGAVGLMQLMPGTAREVAKSMGLRRYNLYDPKTNLELGTCYLTMLLHDFHGSLPTALSYYNAGREGIVSRGVYRNRRYIRIVMDNYWDYVRTQADATGQAPGTGALATN